MEKKKFLIFIIEFSLLTLFLLFVGSLNLVSPFFGDVNLIDEGQYSIWALRMLNGQYMYKDIYITYGPLHIYPLYILYKLFIPSIFIFRLYITSLVILSLLSMRLIMGKLNLSRKAILIAMALLVIIPGTNIRVGFCFLTIYFCIRAFESFKSYWSFLTGVILVLTFLTSPEMGIFSGTIITIYAFYKLIKEKEILIVIRTMLFLFSGIFISLFLFFVWSVKEGWFINYIHTTNDVLFSFSGMDIPNGKNFPNPITLLLSIRKPIELIKFIVSKEMLLYWELFFYISIFFYLGARVILRLFNKHDEILSLISILGIFVYTILIGRPGHFFVTLSPVIIIGAYIGQVFVNRLSDIKSQSMEKLTSFLLLVILICFTLRVMLIFRLNYNGIFFIPKTIFIPKNNPDFVGPIYISEKQQREIKTVHDFINKNTNSNDKIFLLNDEPALYLFIKRYNPTRYDLPYIAHTKEKRLEILSDLQNIKPKYIVEDKNAWPVDEVGNRRRLPEIIQYLQKNYVKEATIDNFIFYRLKMIIKLNN